MRSKNNNYMELANINPQHELYFLIKSDEVNSDLITKQSLDRISWLRKMKRAERTHGWQKGDSKVFKQLELLKEKHSQTKSKRIKKQIFKEVEILQAYINKCSQVYNLAKWGKRQIVNEIAVLVDKLPVYKKQVIQEKLSELEGESSWIETWNFNDPNENLNRQYYYQFWEVIKKYSINI